MATLTYDPSNDPDAIAEAEARDAEYLAIGEEMEANQAQLLAGKYESAEELERAYIELQKAYGSREETTESDEQEVEETEDDSEEGVVLDQLRAEFEEYGSLTQETAELLGEEAAAAIEQLLASEAPPQTDLSQEDVAALHGIVGGSEAYQALTQWAAQNLSAEQIEAYDNVMSTGNVEAAYFAINALKLQYDADNGTEGKLIQGKAPPSSTNAFRSQAEVVRAMNDPRYENDPAYRQDVFNRLEASPNLGWE